MKYAPHMEYLNVNVILVQRPPQKVIMGFHLLLYMLIVERL